MTGLFGLVLPSGLLSVSLWAEWGAGGKRKTTSMKFPIFTALLLSFLASHPGMAQTSNDTAAPSQTSQNSTGDFDRSTRTETSGSEEKNPQPHIYRLGEHLSEAYGRFDPVDDWARHQLKKPPDGSHWVRYGDNYLLVKATDGLITEIIAAS